MEQLQNRLRMKYFARLATLFSCLFITIALTAQNDSVAPQAVTRTQDMIDYEKVLDKGMEDMLNEYYVKRERANSTSVLSSYSDEEQIAETEGVDMDSVYEARVHRMNRIVQLGYGPAVRNYIELYVNKRKRSSSAILGLAQHYYPMMKEVFDKYDLPEELVYLTIIESSLNPTAVSPAGATGIWQFMYTTGKTYGLKANSFVDDRRDPYKATDAAARHLRDLYGIFNDWGLAISAYNCGAGNVRKAIARSGGKNTFWEIRNYLPKETQNYFPAYIGAFYMMKYYKVHGIKPANI
ncbi:MAG: lytic transglycosylase domain-containing protein, partial [Bacteroidales bacterium]|nr:lytic transglycosylase domain-containing protein [Bacteroidales bacterium]